MNRITLIVVVTIMTINLAVGSLAAQRPGRNPATETPEEHKAMMNDAADRQEDLRESLAMKDAKGAAAAASALERLMVEGQAYWAVKKFPDVSRLADLSVTQARAVTAATTAAKLDDAHNALEQLSTTCNACHELHPEQRK